LHSYLIEITSEVFKTQDNETKDTSDFLVDKILDQAGSKGTGKWTSQEAMDLPVSIPTIDIAVAMRDLSVFKQQRIRAANLYKPVINRVEITQNDLDHLENALAFCFAIAYAQGLSMLAVASDELKMNIPLPDVITVWKAGCIIRSALLGNFTDAFKKDPKLPNLLLDKELSEILKAREESIRQVIQLGINVKIPMAGMVSALSYYDAYLSDRMPTNLIQAQRDYFGAHTYQRIDKEGVFHTEWHVDSNE
jgi:6-phosphogluconate dehydrogenase